MTPWPERGFVVTGVSRGLGRALAGALVDRGSFVLGIGRSSAPALSGDRYGFVACDLADTAAIDEALAAALRAFARRGLASACLINNAAVVGPLGVASAQQEALDRLPLATQAQLAELYDDVWSVARPARGA